MIIGVLLTANLHNKLIIQNQGQEKLGDMPPQLSATP